jgi:type IV pilus assembly protein PilY1
MKNKAAMTLALFSFAMFLSHMHSGAMASMSTYAAYPPFLSQTVTPNVLVIVDSSGSMLRFAYDNTENKWSEDISDPIGTYDGYFDTTKNYSYNATYDYFYEDAGGTWSGNVLNFVCMRRIDIAKMALTGGRTATAGDGSTVLLGHPFDSDNGTPWGFEEWKKFRKNGTITYAKHLKVEDATGPYFKLCNSFGTVSGDPYYIRVKVDTTPEGIIQDMGDSVRFGHARYSPVSSGGMGTTAAQGGKVMVYCDVGDATHIANMVSSINSQDLLGDAADVMCNTPLAESLYSAVGYFAQNANTSSYGPRYHTSDYTVNVGAVEDPHYYSSLSSMVWCAQDFVILISDGEATSDEDLPSSNPDLKNSYGETCTDDCYLDDVALWAHTNDIRSSSFGSDLSGTQSITLYTISTFGGGEAILKSAAKYGGFVDANSNNLPDLASEWDKDSDGIPDNYFSASNASDLADGLNTALYDILKRVASGSAISVLSTSETGEGAVYQAYFYPKLIDENGLEITWPGYLQALFIDDYGNMREDTDSDDTLDMIGDKIIDYYFDDVENRTRVKLYDDSDGDGVRDGTATVIELDEIKALWNAGKVLAATDADSRTIYTWYDPDSPGTIGTLDSGEFASTWFLDTNKNQLRPFLGVSTTALAEELINYIRGEDQTGYRSRLIDVDGTNRVWKLGDIVYSTPAVVGRPGENFDLAYGDTSYATFKNTYKDRRSVIYVGANDGMLHAFNGGFFNQSTHQFTPGAGKTLGEELWAYIPYNLLPHLRWLGDTSYSHVYYVDMKPKVVDAKIFSADATHPGGWGTVLVCGMRFGGGEIDITDNFGGGSDTTRTFRSAYFALDITDPESAPALLWEFTDADLGFTTSYPAIVYVDQSTTPTWAVVFGSGPTDYDGTSDQDAQTYMVNLSTGAQLTGSPIATGSANNFMGDPLTVDINVSASQCSGGSCTYASDITYIGNSEGQMYRITGTSWDSAGTPSLLVDIGSTSTPITSAPSISVDDDHRLWIYFGTGRFFADADKTNTDAQLLVGMKEPIDVNDADSDGDTTELTYGEVTTYVNVTDYTVYENGYIDEGDGGTYDTTFAAFVDAMKQYPGDTQYDGWILGLTGGERCITKPTILGGIATFATYAPIADVCSYEGDSYLYALYYKTGTAYYESVIGYGDDTITVGSDTLKEINRSVSMGHGVAASPSLHIGKRSGARVIVQTSTGEILEIDEENLPEDYKSRPLHWIQTDS